MTRLIWGASSDRFYESGVDRGVLFPKTGGGVAWNGLVSVSESPTGGEAKPAYLDGYKFRNLSTAEEFEATIEAFGAPSEFGPSDGSASIQNGLFAMQQPRKTFGLSYRTRIGSADEGSEYAYKIHLVYNALAGPSERSNTTISDSAEAAVRSWGITTRPPSLTSLKPTAHFVIDSRYVPKLLLDGIETMLYGSEAYTPTLPSVTELLGLFAGLSYPLLKLVQVDVDTYEIYEVDNPMLARAVLQPVVPQSPGLTEEPILWLDTSVGDYATPRIVTGG